MKTDNINKLIVSLVTASIIGFAGCTSGGGDGASTTTVGSTGINAAPAQSASVAGTVGSSSSSASGASGSPARTSAISNPISEGLATLVVDVNGNDIFGGEDQDDFVYTSSILNGAFSFDKIGLNDDANETRAFLTVALDNKAPYTEILTLTDNDTISILAEASDKPILTAVFDIASLTQSAKATSFLRFGIKESGSGIESFSKLMSLSEFQAMADRNVTLEDGELSSSVIPTANLPQGLKKLTVEMQSYSSSDENDFKAFPGDLTGFGKDEGVVQSQAAGSSSRLQLESAGFDLLKLTDGNGNIVNLDNSGSNSSKLRAFADGATCNGMLWTRGLRSSEVAIIKQWPDEDTTKTGYQVPIWSNDNASGAWSYIGLATIPDIDASRPSFTMCVDKKWQGWLNCDSALATDRPKQICVETKNQFGDLIGGIQFTGKKGGSYSYRTTKSSGDNIGLAMLEIRDADLTGWEYTYRSALTNWKYVAIDTSTGLATSSNPDCDYDMNISVFDPYTTLVHVKVYDINDTVRATPLVGKYVKVRNSEYTNYYYKSARTDANGEATFKVKPDVTYSVYYEAGESTFNANGTVDKNETADSTRDVSVYVQDINIAPEVSVYAYGYSLNEESPEMYYSISAYDLNGDPITLNGLYIDGQKLTEGTHYTVDRKSQYDGYYYINGTIKLDALPSSIDHQLAASSVNYKLSAKVFDNSNVEATSERNFHIYENRAPYINSLYLLKDGKRYYTYRDIPEGNYTFSVYSYDNEGDEYDLFIKIGSDAEVPFTKELSKILTKGDYNITIRATETSTDGRRSTTKLFEDIHVGNHVPTIGRNYASKASVNRGESIQLTAYVYDKDYNSFDFNVTATANGQEYNLTKVYGRRYTSNDITIDANTTFSIKAFDGEDYSEAVEVIVSLNQIPAFTTTTSVVNTTIFTDDRISFNCNAIDPEGTRVEYEWFLNGTSQNGYSSYWNSSFRKLFSIAGDYNVSCVASDQDGATNTREANVSVRVNQVPVFDTNLTNATIYEDTTHSLTCAAHDPEARGAIGYSWKINNVTLTDENGYNEVRQTINHLFSSAGIYNVSCIAIDIDGKTASSDATISVVANQIPVFDTPLPSTTSVVENKSIAFACSAYDPESTAIAYTWMQDGTVVANQTADSFTTSFDTVQTHTVSCVAIDGDGKSATSVSNVTVTANQAPLFSKSLTSSQIEVDNTVDFECIASDPEQTTIVYSWLKDGVSVGSDDTTYSFLFAAEGTFNVSCTATDSDGKSSMSSATVTVGTSNQPPVIDTDYNDLYLSVNGGETLTGKVDFHDPDGTATIAIYEDPYMDEGTLEGFTIDTATGDFSYDSSAYASLAEGQVVSKWVNLLVTDNEGAEASTSVQVSIIGTYVAPIPSTATSITLPYDFYSLSHESDLEGKGEGIEISHTSFDPDTNKTTESSEYLLFGTSTVVPSNTPSAQSYVNEWGGLNAIAHTNLPFTLNSAGNLLFIPNYNAGLIFLGSDDVSGQTKYVPAIDKNVTFSSGARFDRLAYRNRIERFVVGEAEQHNGVDVQTLVDLININREESAIAGDENSQVVFDLDENITTLDINQTGTLKVINRKDETTQTVGTWEYKQIDKSTGAHSYPTYALFVNITSGDFVTTRQVFFVLVNTNTYRGHVETPSATFTTLGDVYNATAVTDILNTVKSTGSDDLDLSGQTVYSSINGASNTLMSWAFSDDLKTVIATLLEGVSGDPITSDITDVNSTSIVLSTENPSGDDNITTTLTVVGGEIDYLLVSMNGGEAQRVYSDEAKARAYFLTPSTEVKNDSPAVGTWVVGDNLDITLIIADNSHYFFAQGVLGDGGVEGGIEVGQFKLDGNTLSDFDASLGGVNTNAGDTAEGATLTYTADPETLSIEGTDITLVRQKVGEDSLVGGYVSFPGEPNKMIVMILSANGKYMVADVDFDSPTEASTEEDGDNQYISNMFEMGSYEIASDKANITFEVNATLDFNANSGVSDVSTVPISLDVSKYPVVTVADEINFVRVQPNGPLVIPDDNEDGSLSNLIDKTIFYINGNGAPAQITFENNGSITGLDYAYYYDMNYTINDTNVTLFSSDGSAGIFTYANFTPTENALVMTVDQFLDETLLGSMSIYFDKTTRDAAFMRLHFVTNSPSYSSNTSSEDALNSYITLTETDTNSGTVIGTDDNGEWFNGTYTLLGTTLTLEEEDEDSISFTNPRTYDEFGGVEVDMTINGSEPIKIVHYSSESSRDAGDSASEE